MEGLGVLRSQSVPLKLFGQEHSKVAARGIDVQTPPLRQGLTVHGSGTLRGEDWTKTGTKKRKQNMSPLRIRSRKVVS